MVSQGWPRWNPVAPSPPLLLIVIGNASLTNRLADSCIEPESPYLALVLPAPSRRSASGNGPRSLAHRYTGEPLTMHIFNPPQDLPRWRPHPVGFQHGWIHRNSLRIGWLHIGRFLGSTPHHVRFRRIGRSFPGRRHGAPD